MKQNTRITQYCVNIYVPCPSPYAFRNTRDGERREIESEIQLFLLEIAGVLVWLSTTPPFYWSAVTLWMPFLTKLQTSVRVEPG